MSNLIQYTYWKRTIDIIFSIIGIIIFLIPILLIGIVIKIISRGPVIYWSERIGIHDTPFCMAKFRTMRNDTPIISTDSIYSKEKYFIRFGKLLRKTGIDELPQLYNILKGDMSIVGPRPVIADEQDLITYRREKGIDKIRPGLTGLAQINGRNKLSVYQKVKYDELYMQKMNIILDLKIILFTNFYLLKENVLKY